MVNALLPLVVAAPMAVLPTSTPASIPQVAPVAQSVIAPIPLPHLGRRVGPFPTRAECEAARTGYPWTSFCVPAVGDWTPDPGYGWYFTLRF